MRGGEIKVEEFINFKQGNMNVKEYSLKLSMLSRSAPSIMSNLRDEMSYFMSSLVDLVREECLIVMILDYMTLDSLMVYAQSIKDSKLRRMVRNLKRGGSSD